jgi:hypothetical protein
MLLAVSDQRPGPRVVPAHRKPWRARFRAVRAALREAEKLAGKARERALLRVVEMVHRAENDPPVPWKVDAKGMATRIKDASTREYDDAEIALERAVSHACGGCLGCYAMDHGPARRRSKRAKPRKRSKAKGSSRARR